MAVQTGQSSASPFAQNKRLGRGVNVIGYDPLWRDRSKARFKTEHFQMLRDAGFDHVRIPLHPFRDTSPRPDHLLPERYLKTLDWALDEALACGLMAIVDFHEFTEMAKDPLSKKDRFLTMWSQLARHCKDRPDGVLFEVLNEPNGELTPELWNQFLAEAMKIIRGSNPGRTLIVGPAFWNGIGHLGSLVLPEDDRNIIATVHYYSPFEFTHQGAPWTSHRDKVGVEWNATDAECAAVRSDFDKADAWAKQHNRPLYLGEFGAYDLAPMHCRARYTNFVAREAERRGWSWGYWQLDGDFVLYDTINGRWSEPIRDALIRK
jgi:endoglucanase